MASHARPARRWCSLSGFGLRRATGPAGDGQRHGPDCTSGPSVGVALDVGGLGDKSFNDAANAGLDQAIEEGLVCEENTEFLEPNASGSNRDENIAALADEAST